jgi:hypothetical protein
MRKETLSFYSKRQEAEGRGQKAKSLLSGRFILSLCPNLSLACYGSAPSFLRRVGEEQVQKPVSACYGRGQTAKAVI